MHIPIFCFKSELNWLFVDCEMIIYTSFPRSISNYRFFFLTFYFQLPLFQAEGLQILYPFPKQNTSGFVFVTVYCFFLSFL